ncbi:MAG TPA: ABC transporter permease [Candidatus Eisenbacteria bacterium]|nr:ABC transporter permease [Candidatus Eisenbacteria bacterium]
MTTSQAQKNANVLYIRPTNGRLQINFDELWQYRELLYFLIWRDIKIRYKQTVIGAGWAILQPVISMVIFSAIFGNFAKLPSDGVPYPVFSYAALLPWTYFSQAIQRSSASLVSNGNMIKKVYFPRLIAPLSAALAPLVDFAIAFVVLIGMMSWYGTTPTWGVFLLPVFLLLSFLTALGVGLFSSALNVKYRDVGHAMPFVMQVWMFASPVVYSVSIVPEQWRLLYGLNPMAGVIEGFRWGLLGTERPDFGVMMMSGIVVVALVVWGLAYFRKVERSFADVI